MFQLLFFILGIILSIIFVKLIFPKQKTIRVLPSPTNCSDIIYVDEDGVLYQYEITEEHDMTKSDSKPQEK